ncbi:hypothetical protein MPTK1_6g14970 [Marchantia polymorpha subsp. ruderalis]|uniref:Uncharacterized protein n=1 Tax=Marchantia polymorpha subsp. ruderalis TaxID=1480154 RepID=A0AAF6BS62_MARPO|nr:hypothetical protein Mp_6g14970 [Marchantia polymorpha subsp. ruderalis]
MYDRTACFVHGKVGSIRSIDDDEHMKGEGEGEGEHSHDVVVVLVPGADSKKVWRIKHTDFAGPLPFSQSLCSFWPNYCHVHNFFNSLVSKIEGPEHITNKQASMAFVNSLLLFASCFYCLSKLPPAFLPASVILAWDADSSTNWPLPPWKGTNVPSWRC